MRIKFTEPSTKEQKDNYQKTWLLGKAVFVVSILAIVVEGISDYFSLYRTFSAFTMKYMPNYDWLAVVLAAALVISLSVAMFALTNFVFTEIFSSDGFSGFVRNKLMMVTTLALCLVVTSIYTLSTEGAQLVASEYFSEKVQVADTKQFLNDPTEKHNQRYDKDVEAIQNKYDQSVKAEKSNSAKLLAALEKQVWANPDKRGDFNKAKQDAAERLRALESDKSAELKSVAEMRDNNIKTAQKINTAEYERTVATNDKTAKDVEQRNAKNKKGGYYIAFFCLPLSLTCMALKAWIDHLSGRKMIIVQRESDFEQSAIGKLFFAISDGLSGRANNTAVRLHKAISPKQRLTFDDKRSNEGFTVNRERERREFPRERERTPMRVGNIDFSEEFDGFTGN